MPRFRNMNANQQARVNKQIATGNYGGGAAGRAAERRFNRMAGQSPSSGIQTLPSAPPPAPAPAPQMTPPPMDQMRPQISMNRPNPREQFHAQQQAQWNAQKAAGAPMQGPRPMQAPAMEQMQPQMPPEQQNMAIGAAFNRMKQSSMAGAPPPMNQAQGQALQGQQQASAMQGYNQALGAYNRGY